jgi:hypothetical protein
MISSSLSIVVKYMPSYGGFLRSGSVAADATALATLKAFALASAASAAAAAAAARGGGGGAGLEASSAGRDIARPHAAAACDALLVIHIGKRAEGARRGIRILPWKMLQCRPKRPNNSRAPLARAFGHHHGY